MRAIAIEKARSRLHVAWIYLVMAFGYGSGLSMPGREQIIAGWVVIGGTGTVFLCAGIFWLVQARKEGGS